MSKETEKIKDAFLTSMLKLVISKGWNESTLNENLILNDINIEKFYVFFPNGIDDLILRYINRIDISMIKSIQKNKEARIQDMISSALKYRFTVINKQKSVVAKTNKFLVLKPKLALYLAWKTSDSIWSTIGDKSTDFNYYTKRSLLSLVYISTLAYWRSNKKQEDINNFIDRRIKGIIKFGMLKKQTKERVFSVFPNREKILSKFTFFHK